MKYFMLLIMCLGMFYGCASEENQKLNKISCDMLKKTQAGEIVWETSIFKNSFKYHLNKDIAFYSSPSLLSIYVEPNVSYYITGGCVKELNEVIRAPRKDAQENMERQALQQVLDAMEAQ